MSFSYLYSERAKKDLSKLEKDIARRIDKKLQEILFNPKYFLKLIAQYKVYRLRVGDYRIFVDLNEKEKVIEVLTIRKRKIAYQKTT